MTFYNFKISIGGHFELAPLATKGPATQMST